MNSPSFLPRSKVPLVSRVPVVHWYQSSMQDARHKTQDSRRTIDSRPTQIDSMEFSYWTHWVEDYFWRFLILLRCFILFHILRTAPRVVAVDIAKRLLAWAVAQTKKRRKLTLKKPQLTLKKPQLTQKWGDQRPIRDRYYLTPLFCSDQSTEWSSHVDVFLPFDAAKELHLHHKSITSWKFHDSQRLVMTYYGVLWLFMTCYNLLWLACDIVTCHHMTLSDCIVLFMLYYISLSPDFLVRPFMISMFLSSIIIIYRATPSQCRLRHFALTDFYCYYDCYYCGCGSCCFECCCSL